MSGQSWPEAALSEVCSLVTDGTHRSPPNSTEGDFLYVTAKNIRRWGLDLSDITRVSSAVHDEIFARCPVEQGDVLYIKDGVTAGLAAINHLREPFSMLSSVALLKPKRDLLEPRYLKHWLNSPATFARMTGEMTGSAIRRLVLRQIRSAAIPLAPLPEQKRIADKLDTLLARVDTCRNHLGRLPAILKRFRQSVLTAATSGDLTREWREERGLTEEWSLTQIDKISTVGTGSTPLRSNDTFYAQSGTPWVTSAATGLPFVDTAAEFVTDAAIAAHRLKRYAPGTLLVAMYGEGKTRGQVTELRIEATINQACAAIFVDERKATRAFVRIALESNYLKMRDLAEGGNQPNLNLSKIKEFPVLLPEIEEQRQIVKRVHELFALADQLEARYTSARTHIHRLTPALLAKAFRGELVEQEALGTGQGEN